MKRFISLVIGLLLACTALADSVTAPNSGSVFVSFGQRLTVTTDGSGVAQVQRYFGTTLVQTVNIPASTTYVFDQYQAGMKFKVNAFAGTITYTVDQRTDSMLTGTTTNDSPNTGDKGEVLSATKATGSSVSLTTATAANVTSKALTAGDWLCSGTADYTFADTTSFTQLSQGLSTTSATLGAQDTYSTLASAGDIPTSAFDIALNTPLQRVSVASVGATVYLVSSASFSTSTLKAYGSINCWRMR